MTTLLSPLSISPSLLTLGEPAANEQLRGNPYRKLESLWPLLRLLLPDGAGPSHFAQNVSINLDQWAQFYRFASQVREIVWKADDDVSSAYLATVANLVRSSNFPQADDPLRNLQIFRVTIETAADAAAIVPFLPTTLPHLELDFGYEIDDRALIFCIGYIEARCPDIATLSLTVDSKSQSQRTDVVRALVSLFSTLSRLQRLSLPFDLISSDLVDALSRLECLYELCVTAATSPLASPSKLRHFTLSAGQFPVLRILHVSAFLAEAVDVLQATTERIEEVHISSRTLRTPDEMSYALHAIIYFCANLKHLILDISHVHSRETSAWIDLRPLLEYPNLKSLVVKHPRPLPLTDLFISHLLHAFFDIEVLYLNPRPQSAELASYDRELPTLACLHFVAESGQCLKKFGIFLRPDIGDDNLKTTHLSQNVLEVLDLGRSGGDSSGGEYATASAIRRLFPRANMLLRRRNSPWTQRVRWRLAFL